MTAPAAVAEHPTFPLGKRWERRAERWIAPGETNLPREFGVDVMRESDARALVLEHHDSGTWGRIGSGSTK